MRKNTRVSQTMPDKPESDGNVSELLRRSVPGAPASTVARIRSQLPRPAERRQRGFAMPLRVAIGVVIAAVAITTAALLGSGPLSSQSDDAAQAGRACVVRTVTVRAHVPEFSRRADGSPVLRFPVRRVERQVERCAD